MSESDLNPKSTRVSCINDSSIKIKIKTPKRIGKRTVDQQTINAYLINQMELMEQRIMEQINNTLMVTRGPKIHVNVDESDYENMDIFDEIE